MTIKLIDKKFEPPKCINDPELGLIDTELKEYPELIKVLASDITDGQVDIDLQNSGNDVLTL